MSKEIALFCSLHPQTLQKRDRCLDLLQRSAREYYRRPDAQCTTWSYFTPSPLVKGAGKDPAIAGLEIYTDKQALTAQLDDPVYFQAYHDTVKREQLYSRPEELVAWYRVGGFVARGDLAPPFGGVIISCTSFVASDRDGIVKKIESFSTWVRENEPDVLTYAVFTRPKALKEVLLVVRYKDVKALQGHSKAPEHVAVVKELQKQIENDMSKSTTLWQEVEDSFVSNIVGGGGGSSGEKSRL